VIWHFWPLNLLKWLFLLRARLINNPAGNDLDFDYFIDYLNRQRHEFSTERVSTVKENFFSGLPASYGLKEPVATLNQAGHATEASPAGNPCADTA
jgi:hypothetical protein